MKNRELSVDVLKITAMLAVITEHMFLYTNGLNYSEGAGFYLYWAIRVFSKINVDLFVITTAYLSYTRASKLANCVRTMLTTLIVSVVTYWCSVLFFHAPFSVKEMIKSFLPIVSNSYWFITCYVGLYLLFPFLNSVVDFFHRRGVLRTAALTLYIVLTIYPQLFIANADVSNGGRTLVWMIVLYFLACALFYERIPWKKAAVIFFISYLVSLICRILFTTRAAFLFTNESPFVVAMALGFFVLIKEMLAGRKSSKIVTLFASSTLTVYLVHESYLKEQLWSYVDRVINISPISVCVVPIGIYCMGTIVHFSIKRIVDWICSARLITKICDAIQGLIYTRIENNTGQSMDDALIDATYHNDSRGYPTTKQKDLR